MNILPKYLSDNFDIDDKISIKLKVDNFTGVEDFQKARNFFTKDNTKFSIAVVYKADDDSDSEFDFNLNPDSDSGSVYSPDSDSDSDTASDTGTSMLVQNVDTHIMNDNDHDNRTDPENENDTGTDTETGSTIPENMITFGITTRKSKASKIEYTYSAASVLDSDMKKCLTIGIFSELHKEEKISSNMNFYQLTSAKTLLDSAEKYLPESTLTVLVEVCILKKKQVNSEPTKLQVDLEKLLENEKLTDLALVIGEKEFKVHRAILSARSSVFNAMFSHETTESTENRVEITDIQIEVCEELLRYVYTGKVNALDEYAADLLVAAEKYELETLKALCEQALCDAITTESVTQLLILAAMHNACELQTKCVKYIIKHAKDVILAKDWDKIISVRPELSAMLLRSFVLKNQKEKKKEKKKNKETPATSKDE